MSENRVTELLLSLFYFIYLLKRRRENLLITLTQYYNCSEVT